MCNKMFINILVLEILLYGILFIFKYFLKCVLFCDNSKIFYYFELIFKWRFVIVWDIKFGNWGILLKKYYLMFFKFCRGVLGYVIF